MTTITKEWLQQTIAEFENTRDDIPFGLSDDDAKILIVLKQTLASLTAEPVRYLNKFSGTCVTLEQQSNAADDVAVYMPLYAAPPAQPAPVVPPAIEPDYEVIKSILPTANPDEYACCIAADMWNACRAAMLNGGKS
ncbi:Eaa protein [Salmonella enterica subsp. enterica serovar Bredeney]|nr:Eaa protein [Salmonella enterica subsp. enterica serovar Bredeney]